MTKPSTTIQRLIAGITLGIAFLVMASIFIPDLTDAQDHGGLPPGEPAAAGGLPSTDAHEGLRALGSVQSDGFEVDIYATAVGPRYTVCAGGQELGTLLTAEQVAEYFPELPLTTLDFSATSTIMLAEPDTQPW